MVKIINGEIVADDDPRLQQRQQAAAAAAVRPPSGPRPPSVAAAAAAGGGGTGFNPGAPPLRFVDPLPGMQPFFGLPDLEVFGVRVTPYAVLAAVGLGMMLGWRGVAVALVLYYVYLANQGNRPAAPTGRAQGQAGSGAPQGQGQGGSGPIDFLSRYLNGPQPPSRAQPGASGGNRGGGSDGHGGHAGQGYRVEEEDIGPGAEQPGSGSGRAAAGGGWAAFQGKGHKLSGN